MGIYNTIHGEVVCPRCGVEGTCRAECKLGYTNELRDLAVGDEYPFRPGEPPPSQSFSADAYGECPACGLDFGARIGIENRVVRSIRAEPRTLVHRHDGILQATVACPYCGAPGEKEVKLYNGSKLATYRLGDSYPEGARYAGDQGSIRGRAYCELECKNVCFAVKIYFRRGVLWSVAVDLHQADPAEDLY